MADKTKIEWTDATWNPITGCSVVSPGCTNCYAMKLAGTRLRHHPSRAGLTVDTKTGPVWNGEVRFNEKTIDQPLHWKRPRKIFVCAHGDLFHESVPDAWIDRVFAVMALAPQHTFQVLTKRAARMRGYVSSTAFHDRIEGLAFDWVDMSAGRSQAENWYNDAARWPLPNLWLGVSVEDQARADERIPALLDTPAAVRFISAEPLLAPVDLQDVPWPEDRPRFPEIDDISDARSALHVIEGTRIDWVIVGGESGPGARPMHPDWARSLRDQCAAEGVAFFFKQWGAWFPRDQWEHNPELVLPVDGIAFNRKGEPLHRWADIDGGPVVMHRVGKNAAGHLLDGREWREFPSEKRTEGEGHE